MRIPHSWMPLMMAATALILPLASVALAADLRAPNATVEKLADGFRFTEGPAVDTQGNLFFSDIQTIEVPEGPANVTFSGPDGRTLFITGRTGLYAVRMTVRGQGK